MRKLKVKMSKSKAGRTERQRATLKGLGLWRIGQERVLQDHPAIRGMINKVSHLVEWQEIDE